MCEALPLGGAFFEKYKMNFGNQDKLIYRLKNAILKKQKISFLIGSGLTVQINENAPGVYSVKDIIHNIETIFSEDNCLELLQHEMIGLEQDIPAQYQAAMRTLLECQGQDKLNEVIRNAVLNARVNKQSIVLQGDLDYQELEKDFNNWYINDGIQALSALYQSNKEEFNNIILTSNFDPLIEISFLQKEIITQTLNISKDGRFDNIINNGNVVSIAHFHGYWRGSDTLHTIKQLTRPRPNLKASLKQLLKNTLLVILGYGGWDDVFTSTLVEIINENDENLNVLWTFYSDDANKVINSNKNLFEKLDPSLEQRVVLYKGINCHSFFPELQKSITHTTIAKEDIKIYEENPIAANKIYVNEIFTSDNPVVNYKWVGRINDLKTIDLDVYNVIYISGMGGQGKSGLAAKYLEEYVSENSVWEFWDWRDCKEEANRIHSKIVSIIERITNGEFRASSFIGEKVEDIINLFFDLIKERHIVFVFDNVDYYIDIEKFKLIGVVGHLFDEAIARKHKCKFIFTGRPSIANITSNFLILKLEGLNIDETQELFLSYNLPLNSSDLSILSKTSYNLTKGHPLWLLLIIGQAFKGKENVESFIHEMTVSDSFKGSDESDILAGYSAEGDHVIPWQTE
ncbi:MAG: NB-ARC domain-containing protein, partial [Mucilaginibacter sp.]